MEFLEFYRDHPDFIPLCARMVVKLYGCENVREDLESAGTVAALEQIGRYDEGRGAAVTTFLRPHIIGAMRREAERYLGLLRGELKRQKEKSKHLAARLVLLDDAGWDTLQLASEESVEQQAYIKICLEHLRAAFDGLSYKERAILGGFFGVFGHKKESLAEIGEAFHMKEDGALKAKNRALDKLRRACMEGGLGYWMSVRAAIRGAVR